MAVTAIRLVRNATTQDAFMYNHENPDDTPGPQGVFISRGGIFECNIWVPWADDEDQYNKSFNNLIIVNLFYHFI